MKLATLTKSFTAVMNESSKAERNKSLREDFELHQTNMVNMGDWRSNIDYDINILTDAKCAQIVGHGWFTTNLETATGPLDTSLTLFNFLRADTSTSHWAALVDLQHSITGDELHEPDIKKHKRKPRQLYMHGHMLSRADLVTAISNFLCLIHYMIEDPEKGGLYGQLKKRLDGYTSMEGRNSIEAISRMPGRKHLVHALIMDSQRVLQQFLKHLSCDPNTTAALGNGDTLRADNSIDAIITRANAMYLNQDLLLCTHCHTHYSTPNPTYARMIAAPKLETGDVTPTKRERGPDTSNNANNARDRNKKKSGNGNQAKPPGTPKPVAEGKLDLTDQDIVKRKAQGYFEKIGNGKTRTKLRHEFSQAATPNKRPCNGHLYKDVFCSQKSCNAYHTPLTWASIPGADQKAMCQFAADNPDTVTWAPGKTPTQCSTS